jgi:hypothetical protein
MRGGVILEEVLSLIKGVDVVIIVGIASASPSPSGGCWKVLTLLLHKVTVIDMLRPIRGKGKTTENERVAGTEVESNLALLVPFFITPKLFFWRTTICLRTVKAVRRRRSSPHLLFKC